MTSQARPETNLVDGVALQASASKLDDKTWKIDLQIENGGTSTVFIYDRLWDLNQGKHVPDAEPCYRFERNGALRLLFGAAPLPRKYTTTYRNVPHTTMLSPGESKKHTLVLVSPVHEHSPYFVPPHKDPKALTADGKPKNIVEKTVQALEIGVQVLPDRPELKRRKAVDDQAVDFEQPVALLQLTKLLRAKVAVEGLVVNRRTDYFERLVWPGEAPEPM